MMCQECCVGHLFLAMFASCVSFCVWKGSERMKGSEHEACVLLPRKDGKQRHQAHSVVLYARSVVFCLCRFNVGKRLRYGARQALLDNKYVVVEIKTQYVMCGSLLQHVLVYKTLFL